jgi:membrane-associated phospholipid phosphatase
VLGVHFVSDVVAGLILGVLVAVGLADVMRVRRRDVDDEPAAAA